MKKAKLLWLDLEMTGLDPKKDKILVANWTEMLYNNRRKVEKPFHSSTQTRF